MTDTGLGYRSFYIVSLCKFHVPQTKYEQITTNKILIMNLGWGDVWNIGYIKKCITFYFNYSFIKIYSILIIQTMNYKVIHCIKW